MWRFDIWPKRTALLQTHITAATSITSCHLTTRLEALRGGLGEVPVPSLHIISSDARTYDTLYDRANMIKSKKEACFAFHFHWTSRGESSSFPFLLLLISGHLPAFVLPETPPRCINTKKKDEKAEDRKRFPPVQYIRNVNMT